MLIFADEENTHTHSSLKYLVVHQERNQLLGNTEVRFLFILCY